MTTARLTAAQALTRFLSAQYSIVDGHEVPLFAGVWAIFGHGNVAGLGEALYQVRETLPTFRAHNEQAMAHTAIAFAKAHNRRRMMVATTSIGPGAVNLATAAALAHVNRLPILLLPGDVFASRRPDPVLQQIENFGDPTITANDCLRPLSRFWDRITRPEQLIQSLPAALRVLTDPVDCGPATLCLTQDVQTEAYDYPTHLFARRVHSVRRPRPDECELDRAADLLTQAQRPLLIAGGGVGYSLSFAEIDQFATKHGVPVAETQAGKGVLPWHHPRAVGSIGVTGTSAANKLATEADVILAVGTRLQDFTTASRSLFQHPGVHIIGLNVASFDAHKHNAVPLVCDAKVGLHALSKAVGSWAASADWTRLQERLSRDWNQAVEEATAPLPDRVPTDAQVLGTVNRHAGANSTVVCAAGGLPGELHKLWRTQEPGGYHLEYGFSCMGYEIAGGLGVKLAQPQRDVYVLVGDGSYLMLNSEIATSIQLDAKLTIVVLNNRGYGCINRLQKACGGAPFNNLWVDSGPAPAIDFAGHAAALGAQSETVPNLLELPKALTRAQNSETTYVIVIETDPQQSTRAGGAWWDVAVPEISPRPETLAARADYEAAKRKQTL